MSAVDVKFKMTAALTCQCRIVSPRNTVMNFDFKAVVRPKGRAPNVCFSNVGPPDNRASLKTIEECVNRYSHISKEPIFRGVFITIKAFFETDGSSSVQIRGTSTSHPMLDLWASAIFLGATV